MMSFDFPLLSDPDKEIAERLDVKRARAHPMSMFPRRVTYLIDPEGRVARAYDVGRNLVGHAEEVLADLGELVEGAES